MNCSNCSDIWERQEINSPGQLTSVLQTVKAAVAQGILVSEEAAELGSFPIEQSATFQGLKPEGPWPDVIDYYFRCAKCGQRFQLSAETYHGNGGEWSRLGR